MSAPRALALLAVAALLAGCPEEAEDSCAPDAERRAAADLVQGWYLYPELVVDPGDPAAYASTGELLDAMTAEARSRGLDRGWSYVTTAAATQATLVEGTAVGFGLGLLQRGDRLLVSQVYPGSAAADAGFLRGDEIVRLGETEATLVAVGPIIAADRENGTNGLGALIGPAAEGVTRAFEVVTAGGATVPRAATKRAFGLDPVPATDAGERWKIFDRGAKKLGYVALRTFISTADARLVEAFRAFRAAGVNDVAVDLRYNGGGLVSTGELLADLLGGGLQGLVMARLQNNAALSRFDEVELFDPLAPGLLDASVTATRVAFITTGASASASELVPNVLEPHREVALVGATTHGKPVGQRGFRVGGCETVLYLVSFRLSNAEGDGAYYAGLPDAGWIGDADPLCAAEDDLGHAQWDEAEASTSAALHWLEAGACPAPPAQQKAALAARGADRYPAAVAPSLAQRHVAGLF